MKKLFIAALFSIFITCGYGQDVKVNNNNDATATDDCAYRINGICSSEDIGGVDVQFKVENSGDYYAVFTNYNAFPVTVIARCTSKSGSTEYTKTMNIVLGVNGSKEIKQEGYRAGSVEGMIVRKLAQ